MEYNTIKNRTVKNVLNGAAFCLITGALSVSLASAQSSQSSPSDDLPSFLKKQLQESKQQAPTKQGGEQSTPSNKLRVLAADKQVTQTAFMPVQIPATRIPTVSPDKAYNGCEVSTEDLPSAVGTGETNRDRILEASDPERVDKLTQRTFASFDIDEADDVGDQMEGLCWKRLDGVWQELNEITLDRAKDNGEIWDVEGTELASLTNGNYTSANFLVVAENGVGDDAIHISSGLGTPNFVAFTSTDSTSLDDALKRGGKRKTYRASTGSKLGRTLAIDVSRSGRIRLIMDGKTFLRPAPGVSKAAMNAQVAANDVFLLAYNLENLSASRKGYDVIKQDPFYLLQNPKFDVFAEVDANKYVISEKRTVPLGFTLIKEDMQGNVFRKTLVSSETQYQSTISDSYGGNAKVSLSGAANTALAAVPASGTVAETSFGAGFDSTRETMNSMRNKEFVGQSVGYSRTKKYALVVDHPFVTLSDDFLDAVEDARRYGNYQGIIDKFGTHYPYAVTYGANAKMTGKVTDEEYETAVRESEGNAENAQLTIMESGISGYMKNNSENMEGNKGNMGNENSTFVAVGGSGSWDQSGYSSGETPYPILLDLRPIDELLNPLNFPGEPEIYSTVRANLGLAASKYLSANSRPLRNESLLPEVSYTPPPPKKEEPIETWRVYASSISCQDQKKQWLGGVYLATNSVEGRLTIMAEGPQGQGGFAKAKTLKVNCRDKKQTKKYSYGGAKPDGLLTIKGTRAEIAKYKITYQFNWNYNPKLESRTSTKTHKKTVLQTGLKRGTSKTYDWGIGAKGKSDVYLGLRIKRSDL